MPPLPTQTIGGDPRRPADVQPYRRVVAAEDQADLYLIISLVCSMLALFAKVRDGAARAGGCRQARAAAAGGCSRTPVAAAVLVLCLHRPARPYCSGAPGALALRPRC